MPLNVGRDEFLAVFTEYNHKLWPAPEILSLLAFAAVCLALFPGPRRDRVSLIARAIARVGRRSPTRRVAGCRRTRWPGILPA